MNPWDSELCDILLPMHDTTVEQALEIIRGKIEKPALARTPETAAALLDFQLAAKANILLAQKGYDAKVLCEEGYATLVINQYSVRMERLEEDVKGLVATIEGIKGVTTRVGPRFRQPGIYLDFDGPDPLGDLVGNDLHGEADPGS